MSDSSLPTWSIEARAFLIYFTPFTHNFWALVNEEGQVIDQLHGLAVDPATGTSRAIGNSSHLLQAVQDESIVWSLQPKQPATICASASPTVLQDRWQAAVNAIPAINALHLPYPNLWQQGFKPNSNSMFNTLGKILGFCHPGRLLPTWAPGIRFTISPEIVAQYAYSHRLA